MSNYQVWDEKSKKMVLDGLAMGVPNAVLAKILNRSPGSVEKFSQRNRPEGFVRGSRRTYRQNLVNRRVIDKQDHILGQYLFSETYRTEPLFYQESRPLFLEVIEKAEALAKSCGERCAEIEDARTGEVYAHSLGLKIQRVPLDTSPTSYGYMLDRTLQTPGQILLKINMIREASNLMPLIVLEWLGEM
jgi:hypothetical protein